MIGSLVRSAGAVLAGLVIAAVLVVGVEVFSSSCGGVRGVDGLLEAELAVDRASTRVVLLYFEGEFTAASLFRFREDRVEQQATDALTTQRRFHKEVANVDQGLGGERRETAEASSDADRLITMKSEKDQ